MEEGSNPDNGTLLLLGEIYHLTISEYQNYSKALEYYEKIQTDSHSLRDISLLYEYGDGVDENYQKAMSYYQKSAQEKNKGAYYNIALLYYHGNGVEKDYTISFGWFKKVVEGEANQQKNHVYAQIVKDHPDTVDSTERRVYSFVPESFIYQEAHRYLDILNQKGQDTDVC
jgi:TPR repeat protein